MSVGLSTSADLQDGARLFADDEKHKRVVDAEHLMRSFCRLASR